MNSQSEPVGGGETMQDAGTFLKRLAFGGGAIVSTAALSADEIVLYRNLKRMWVDDDGLGYVLLSEYWRKRGDEANKARIVHIADALMEVKHSHCAGCGRPLEPPRELCDDCRGGAQ